MGIFGSVAVRQTVTVAHARVAATRRLPAR